MVDRSLPEHPHRRYQSAGVCVYCGSTAELHDEHIIPYALCGRWILPSASCADCGKKTGAFEGTCARTILGPLRMLYNIQSRRRKERPKTLPLKVRKKPNADWTTIEVRQEEYPFLVLLPHLELPDELTGNVTAGERSAKANKFWTRGAFGQLGVRSHLEALARRFGVVELMPTGEVDVPSFCLLLAKVAHSYATAEIRIGKFEPFLPHIITTGDLSNCVQFIGGIPDQEPETGRIHEVSFDQEITPPEIVAVRIRLLACLGTPTYFVAAGRRDATPPADTKTAFAQ